MEAHFMARPRARGRPAVIMGVLLLTLLATLIALPASAQSRRPLLMEGKKTLFQRVLTRPGQQLHQAPSASSPAVGAQLPPFELFYVYERRGDGRDAWIEVGRRDTGETQGWLPASATIDWKQ